MVKKKEGKKISNSRIENEKLCAILSYLLVGIIWWFADENMKKSEFAKFHVKQGIILFILNIIFWFVASIPIMGWIVSPILWIILLILIVIGMINAGNGLEKKLPIIGEFARKLNF